MSALPYRCMNCGASARPGCDCGVGYIPAGQYAEKAVAANPEKSDRAIAADTGLSQPTVSRARKRSTDTNVAVEKRTGRDGKTRKMPKRNAPTQVSPDEVNARYRDLMKRFREFETKTNKWVAKVGFANLEQDARNMMRDGLMVIANELMLLAQKFDRR